MEHAGLQILLSQILTGRGPEWWMQLVRSAEEVTGTVELLGSGRS